MRPKRTTRTSMRCCTTHWWTCVRPRSCCSWTALCWSATCAPPGASPTAAPPHRAPPSGPFHPHRCMLLSVSVPSNCPARLQVAVQCTAFSQGMLAMSAKLCPESQFCRCEKCRSNPVICGGSFRIRAAYYLLGLRAVVRPAQVASLNVLARLYIARFQYADAAAVYAALAQRKAGLGDQAVDLAERLDLYQSAVLQACPLQLSPTSACLCSACSPMLLTPMLLSFDFGSADIHDMLSGWSTCRLTGSARCLPWRL